MPRLCILRTPNEPRRVQGGLQAHAARGGRKGALSPSAMSATLARPARAIANVMHGRSRLTCALATDRASPRVRVRHRIAAEDRPFRSPGASGSAAARYGRPAPRPEHKRSSPGWRLMLSHEWSTSPSRPIVGGSPSIRAMSEHLARPLRPRQALAGRTWSASGPASPLSQSWRSDTVATPPDQEWRNRPTRQRSERWSWRVVGQESGSAGMLVGGRESGDRQAFSRSDCRRRLCRIAESQRPDEGGIDGDTSMFIGTGCAVDGMMCEVAAPRARHR